MNSIDGPSLRRGFVKHAAITPSAPALIARGITRSYGELDRTARRWAHAILRNLEAPPERVGVFAYRSEVSYAGTLAALMAGATFVPLNPTFPAEKTASMIRAADLDAVIVDRVAAQQVSKVLSDSAPLLLTPEIDNPQFLGIESRRLDRSLLTEFVPLADLPPLTPDTVAYLLFTSGSTGSPKGVPVTHGNAQYFIDVMSKRYQIRADDRFSQTFDQTFDLSVFDLFMAWNNGACVCSMATLDLLAPVKFINQNGITVWFSVPSVPAQMLTRKTLKPDSMPSLRWSLFCGEPLPRRSAEAWQAAAQNSILENLYGPTELTIACLVHRWDPLSSPPQCHHGLVPIGKPLEGLSAVVVDDQLHDVARGEMGELCVSGPQTTLGYWRDPVKTAERYVDLPIGRNEARRFYRTGDRVFRLQSGEYAFVGRTDNQVKVLGHRVELGEIEAVLSQDPGVEHAIAIAWPTEQGSARGIVAFISGSEISQESILQRAREALPAYMVPSRIFLVDHMPLNANGKVDRPALMGRLS